MNNYDVILCQDIHSPFLARITPARPDTVITQILGTNPEGGSLRKWYTSVKKKKNNGMLTLSILTLQCDAGVPNRFTKCLW